MLITLKCYFILNTISVPVNGYYSTIMVIIIEHLNTDDTN